MKTENNALFIINKILYLAEKLYIYDIVKNTVYFLPSEKKKRSKSFIFGFLLILPNFRLSQIVCHYRIVRFVFFNPEEHKSEIFNFKKRLQIH